MPEALSDPFLVIALIFVCAAIAAHQVQAGVARALRDRGRARRRLAELGEGRDVEPRPGLRRAPGTRIAFKASLDRLVLQSGTRARPTTLLAATLALGLALAVVLPLPGPILRVGTGLLVGTLVVVLALRVRRARRLARFGEQLPEVIDVVVRSLRAGHPLPVSLALVAREMPEPAGPEFAWVVDEVQYGRSVGEALEGLRERIGDPELGFLVAAVSIAHQTGGNLGEILGRLARTLRDRARLKRRVRALSAEGRFSGYALSALPIILFIVINLVSARYYEEFWESPNASAILGVALVLLVVGNAVIYRLVNFEV